MLLQKFSLILLLFLSSNNLEKGICNIHKNFLHAEKNLIMNQKLENYNSTFKNVEFVKHSKTHNNIFLISENNKIEHDKNFLKEKNRKEKKFSKSIISQIHISGNTIISSKVLQDKIVQLDLKHHFEDSNEIRKKLVQLLTCEYYSRGYYNAIVRIFRIPIDKKYAIFKIIISEGDITKISQFFFKGNKIFSDEVLSNQLSDIDIHQWWNFIASNNYTTINFNNFLKNILFLYHKRGYLDCKIFDVQMKFSSDRKTVDFLICIDEGHRYFINKVEFHGDDLKILKKFKNKINKFITGSYDILKVNNLRKKIYNIFLKLGYCTAIVELKLDIDPILKNIILHIYIDSGEQYFINKIFFKGNKITHDSVLSNLIIPFKNSYFNKILIEKNCIHLMETGFFKSVKVNTSLDSQFPNHINICFIVEENQGYDVHASAGYSVTDGLLYKIFLIKKNLYGTGSNVSLNVVKDKSAVNSVVSLTPPSFLFKYVQVKINAFLKSENLKDVNSVHYTQKNLGANIIISTPRINYKKYLLALKYSKEKFNNFYYVDTKSKKKSIVPIATEKAVPENYFSQDLSLNAIYDFNNFNNVYYPTCGSNIQVSGEISFPYSSHQINDFSISIDKYIPFNDKKNIIFHIFSKMGVGINTYHFHIPFDTDFQVNSYDEVRGLKHDKTDFSIFLEKLKKLEIIDSKNIKDIKDFLYNRSVLAISGLKMNVEILLPNIKISFPWLNRFQMGTFLDTAASNLTLVKQKNTSFSVASMLKNFKNILNVSAGTFLRWFSPFGPLTFTFAVPLHYDSKNPHNHVQNVSISFDRS